VNVEAAREFTPRRNTENGRLLVNNEDSQTGSPSKPVSNAMLPEVSKAPFYIGGVPPGFVSGTTKAPGADHGFYGCLRDIQINGEFFDPFESQNYYGIEPSCKSMISKAGFYGNGYLELPSHTLRKRANFAFVFRTLQPDCLLLFSGFPPQTVEEFDEKDSRGNFSVSLISGSVQVWIASEKGAIQLESNVTVNDGEFHVVNVNKFGRRFELRIDDNLDVTKSLPASKALISSPEDHGGLFFGGVPDFPEFDNLMPTMNGLRGAIKDVVFNNRTISFDSPISFKNVKFGALGPIMGSSFAQEIKTEPIGAKFKEIKEGCQRVSSCRTFETLALTK
jgi:laminin alpha 1/2